jgi:hypothetical protein
MFSAPPNQTDYTAFLYDVVGIPELNLPDTAAIIPTSLTVAMDIVSDGIKFASPDLYVLAVYNLAADRLLNFAPDLPGQTWFRDLRKDLKLLSPNFGVPSSGGDQGTAVSLLNPEALKNLTLANLAYLKTPCGRHYLEIAQAYGNIWGVT